MAVDFMKGPRTISFMVTIAVAWFGDVDVETGVHPFIREIRSRVSDHRAP
jgi:hypothetical protein